MKLRKLATRIGLAFGAMLMAVLLFGSGSALAATNGRMIDDGVFDASGSMSAADIQTFLNGFPNSCIKSYSDEMPVTDPLNAYFSYSGSGSAAQIIRRVADNWGINPRVLLTKLEQESNLVSGSGGCSQWRYWSAIGFNCPGPVGVITWNGQQITTCVQNAANVGLARQLSKGGWLLKWGKERANGNLNWLIPDDGAYSYSGPMTQGTRKRCNSCAAVYYDGYWQGVYLESGATASLYNYTPFLNQAFDDIWEGWWGAGSTIALTTNWRFEGLDGAASSISQYDANVGPNPTGVVFNSNQYVIYYDVTGGDLRLATETAGVGWSFSVLDGNSTTGGRLNARLGWRPKAIIYQGVIHVYYYDIDNGNLRHAWSNTSGSGWQFETLDGNSTVGGRLDKNLGQGPTAVVSGADIHVFYHDVDNGDLRHAWWSQTGNTWRYETLDGSADSISHFSSNLGYESTATMFGATMQLYYYDADNGNLRHAWDDGIRGWQFENLDGDPGAVSHFNSHTGRSPVVSVINNVLQLFYYDAQFGNLRHAWTTPSGWKFENLDGDKGAISGFDSNVGLYPSVTTYLGTIQLAYYDASRGVLRHGFAGDIGWGFEDFDGNSRSLAVYSGDVGSSSLTLVSGSILHMYYPDASRGDVRHAWFTP